MRKKMITIRIPCNDTPKFDARATLTFPCMRNTIACVKFLILWLEKQESQTRCVLKI